MLHHPRMKTLGFTHNRLAFRAEPFVANALITLHCATQTRYGQAAFPVLFKYWAQRRDQWIDQDGLRYRFGIGVAFAVLKAKNHQLQINPDLRRRQTHAARMLHGLQHVIDQLPELRAVEHVIRHRLGNVQQALIAHFQNFTNHSQASSEVGLRE